MDSFIQDLYRLADDCEYGLLKNELIRDRIIVGVLDDALSDRLHSKLKLTLEEAVQISRQAEARQQSREVVRGSTLTSTNSVNMVKRASQNNKQKHPQKNNPLRVSTSVPGVVTTHTKTGSNAWLGMPPA